MPDVDLPDLATWLPTRRWFAGKGRSIEGVLPADVAALSPDGPWLVAVAVAYSDGVVDDRWLLVLAPADGDAGSGAGAEAGPDGEGEGDEPGPRPVGTVDDRPVVELDDAPQAALALVEVMRTGAALPTDQGQVLTAAPVRPAPMPAPSVRPMGAEQSNTSVVVGEEVVVKVLRHLEPGPNPDVEVGAALTSAGFRGAPAVLGTITGPADEAMVVASRFIGGGRDAWELAVAEAAGRAEPGIRSGMAELGRTVAALHEALQREMPTQVGGAAAATRWREDLEADLAATVPLVRDVDADAAADLERRVRAVLDAAPRDMGPLQRVHGDLHLGQVLLDAEGGWWLLDFEGEPGRPVAERRRPAPPMRDVAGMLRSIDYARAQAIRSGGDPSAARAWAEGCRTAFLQGYGGAADPWLEPLEVEKALYEVRYEAANRPDWLPIPLAALGVATPEQPSPVAVVASPAATPPPAAHEEAAIPAAQDPTPPDVRADARPPAGISARPPAGSRPAPRATMGDAAALAAGALHDPHRLLGAHPEEDGWVVRAWRPNAESVAYLATPDAEPVPCTEVTTGLFEVRVAEQPRVGAYRLRTAYPGGGVYDLVDPYSFPPSLGEVDRHLLAEGRHEQAWTVMGANRRVIEGISGVAFALWAPNARAVRVAGDFNTWEGILHPMRSLGSSGIWELFIPDVPDGAHYKYELLAQDGRWLTRADPWAKWSEVPPGTASRVFTPTYEPGDVDRPQRDPLHEPMSIYEVHLGSWRHRDGRPLTYRELAEDLAGHVLHMGFTHVEFLPVAEHPFGGSWGYQVTGQFAPTSRFGTPDDFRYLVDRLHQQGIGVIVDWVPAHFPKDEWALRLFDGTALYEHEDPRLGEHPDWGTMVFNYGRTEVRNFLVASALYWLEVMGVDGLRVDAVASMLYLDYSRNPGEWIPNEHGGRENLRAVELLQEVNATAYKRNPRAFTIAEESTAWPGVSRPTHLGGLGFGFKWNMGWMHDTLAYFQRDPIHRRWHHDQLTFGLMYAFSENFVLPLSHDEVVHGKGSLIGKMPGDDWQRRANLRALYGWMWGHPGKKLLFMGQEFGQEREWSEERELDWWLTADEGYAGIQRLVCDLNAAYKAQPALWQRDEDAEAFSWIDANNADANVLSFLRRGDEGTPDVAVIANLSPTPRYGMRIGLSRAGYWEEVLNTDAGSYGGSNVGNLGGVQAEPMPWHGQPASAEVTCPPLGVIWLQAPA